MSVRMTQVTALILRAIGSGHRYGFDIMDATGLASGTVYPALRRLEGAGLVAGRWEEAPPAHRNGRPQRRFYTLTSEGMAAQEEVARKLAGARALLMGTAPGREA